MYCKERIGKELKEKINQRMSVADISKWALEVYLTDIAANDSELDAILSKLMMMNEGSDFELSRKELIAIANILIVADSPIYTRQQFGKELKEKIQQKVDVAEIGRWSYDMYYKHMLDIDNDFQNFLIDLNAMEDGPEFEFSYKELDKIADRLIAGEKNIELYDKAKKN
jgi:hypothetical protein